MVFQVGSLLVHCPFPCDVLAVFLVGTPLLAPSVYNNNSYSLNETSARISRFIAPSWVEDNSWANYYPSNERVRLVASRLRRERLIDFPDCHDC